MGFLEAIGLRKKAQLPAKVSMPLEMIMRWLASGQVVWYNSEGDVGLEKGYKGNHVIFTLQDWKAKKVASCPPLLYKVKSKKNYKRYKSLLKDATNESFIKAMSIKSAALEEIEDSKMDFLFQNPNPYMTWFQLVYGHVVYKDLVGAAYWSFVRDGISDQTEGKVKEIWLLPSHLVQIVSGGIANPIQGYKLKSAPDKEISSKNVMRIANFSPDCDNQFEWLYGMPRIRPALQLIQEYNEGTEVKVEANVKRGVRDIVFPKGNTNFEEITLEQSQKVQDNINKKVTQAGPGGVIANNIELGYIRVGLSPVELGILESQKVTKIDLCALYHISPTVFGWSEQSTYNNASTYRKTSVVDAVLPELEELKDHLNQSLIKSWYPDGDVVLDFDYQAIPEMQEDTKALVEWMDKAGCLTANEKRAALGYDRSTDENADKVLVGGSVKLLENLGIDSFDSPVNDVFSDNNEAN